MVATNAKQSQTPWLLLGLAAVLLVLRVVFPSRQYPWKRKRARKFPKKSSG